MAHCFSWELDHFLSCPLTDFALSVTPSFLYLLLFSFQNIHLKYCNKDTAITYCILTQCHISFHTFSAPGFLFHCLYSFKFCSQFSSSKTVLAGVTDKSVYFYCVAILCSLKTLDTILPGRLYFLHFWTMIIFLLLIAPPKKSLFQIIPSVSALCLPSLFPSFCT